MQILKYSLLFFINFCNSFLLTKNYPKLISIHHKFELNMGCDYYIDKNLHIYDYNDKVISYINLEHNRGYFFDYSLLDEDEDDYDKEVAKEIKRILQPSMEPITIFINNTFCKTSFEKKYKKLIDYELIIYNKTWDNVNKIIKKEERYER